MLLIFNSRTTNRTTRAIPTTTRSIAFLFVLVLLSQLVGPSFSFADLDMADNPPREQMMVGGYSKLQDNSEEYAVKAAQFAFEQLINSQNTPGYSFATSNSLSTSKNSVKIVKGYEQVVAGMNYKLILQVSASDDTCLGGFAVTIYDRFGDLSVTKFGQELSCDKLYALEQDQGDFHETYEQDFLSTGGD